MFKRKAKFISALFASFLAGLSLATMSCGTARAAEECLAGPKAHAPQGGHWYYYIDHPTKRHCWYLGEEHGKLSRTASPNLSKAATPELQNPEAAMQPSVANARAELPAQSAPEQPDQGNAPAPAETANAAIWDNGAPGEQTQRWIVASRWPDGSEPNPPINPAPDKSDPSAGKNSAAPAEPPAPTVGQVAAASPLAEAPTYSMPMQLAALMGALAIAGLIGSVVFKFSGSGRAVQVQADALRPDFSRASHEADDRGDRVAEFFAQLSRRPPA
jgi:hypothetical protein